jgi:hypothetical protein
MEEELIKRMNMSPTITEEKEESPIVSENKKKKIIIALPGDSFSSKFLISWTSTLNTLWESGKYDIVISPGINSYVTFARMQTLGLDVLKGISQQPFNDIDFDIWVTIDSDIIFSPQQFITLIESTEINPVVCGMYRMIDLKKYAIVKDWNIEYFKNNGSFEFLTPEIIEQWKEKNTTEFMEVAYSGMGFMAVKKEVLCSLTYPYFQGELIEIKGKNGELIRELASEDVCFCKNIQKAGYKIVINTNLRVGHLKSLVI